MPIKIGVKYVPTAHTNGASPVQVAPVSDAPKDMTWFKEYLRKPKRFMPTGFTRLDGIIDGLYPENITIIGARPYVGKTTIDMNLVYHMKGQRHLVFPTEISSGRWWEMFVSMESGIDDKLIRTHDPDTVAALDEVIDRVYAERNIHVVGGYKPTLIDVRRHIDKYEPDVLHIDYFQNMQGQGEPGYRYYTSLVEGLHHLSIEYHIPVVLMSQLARFDKSRADDKPRLSDLKESGKLEEAAKQVLLLSKEGDNIMLDVAKNRDGGTGQILFKGEWHCKRVEETI